MGVYGGMDFETRDRYRHVVERLSRGARLEETEVARRALAHARRYLVGQGGEVIADADLGALREAHVGYYLVDAGRRGLERDLGYRPTLDLPRMLEWLIAYYRIELEQPTAAERPAQTLVV